MNIQEANKIIYYYMKGEQYFIEPHYYDYHELLDALIPVWDKLQTDCWEKKIAFDSIRIDLDFRSSDFRVTICSDHPGHPYIKDRKSMIREAACIATAKLIKKLNE